MFPKLVPLVNYLWIEQRGLFKNKIPGDQYDLEKESKEKMKGLQWLQVLSWPRHCDDIHFVGNAQGELVCAKVYIVKKIVGDKNPGFKSLMPKKIMNFFPLLFS